MEVKEENILNKLLCYACLCVGRCLYKITNQDLVRYYLDALDEIPLSKTKQLVNITVCWECKAILQKCWSFREQAKDCYRILLTYTNENLNECLFSDVSRPSHLQIQQMDSINITSEQSQDHHTSPIHVKEENLKDNEIKDSNSINDVKGGSISDSFVDDCLSDGIDNENEQMKAELDTIMFCNEREDKEIGRSKAKRVKKIVKRIKRKKNLNECLFSDVSRPSHLPIQQMDSINITSEHSQDHHPSRIHVKQEEIKDNEIKDSNSINGVKGGSISDSFVDECLSDGIDNEDEQVKAELETIMFCNNREDKEGVRSKAKRAKKIVKRIHGKKPKRKKMNQKVVVIELSYEEMLEERESESKRDSYVKAEFKCDTCLLGFHYKKTYQAHMKSKHSTALGAYICPICKTIISSVDSFTAHYKRHMRRYECVICHKRTTDLKVMEHHYYSTHEISLKQYTCNICGKLSNSVDTHRYHKDTHKARIQCPDCDKSFRHRAGLMNHRLAVHECQNAFPCAVCNKVFRWKTSLKRHLQKHEPKNKPSVPAEPFCTMCNISFSSVCSYQRHMKNSLKHVTQDQLRFICDHCNRRFSDKTKLRDHIEEKHLHKTYQCHICSKPSKNRVGLDQHIRNVHMGRPKNKMCHYCGRGFPTKMQLESHIRTHTGERPFICEFCPTTFSQQSNLYKHNRQVHLNIKTKRYPIVKKRKEDDQNQIPKVPALTNQPELEEPYRAIVLQYSPEREFVL